MLKAIIILFAFVLTSLSAQNFSFNAPRHVKSELVTAQDHIIPGEPIWVGLKLTHDPHWHTYWKTTATGYATSIDWDLPEGFVAGNIVWPAPKMYEFEGFVEYIYEGEVILPIRIETPADFEGDSVTIKGTADWLMCEKVCIPGNAVVSLTLPVNTNAVRMNPDLEKLFDKTLSQSVPAIPESIGLRAWQEGNQVVLEISGKNLPRNPLFFDEQTFIVPTLNQPTIAVDPETIQMRFDIDSAGIESAERFVGVLAAEEPWGGENGRRALVVDVPLQPEPVLSKDKSYLSLISIVGLAFIGGLILNLMPCVFPVLGIKIMGFVNQAGESKSKVALHGLTFTFGVLLSFWLLATLLLILRSSGQELGWGFQLQSAPFVFLLMVFLFLFALNLTGMFEVGQSAVGVGHQLTAKSGLTGSFFSGVLATVVATPCAAPFLAPALGAALTLPPTKSIIVFTAIGLGLSLPYLLLSFIPSLIKFLPRPGAWMETFKQFMSFPLFATVAFLLWVLAGQLSESVGYSIYSLFYVFISLTLVAFAGWIYGRWGAYHRKKGPRRLAYAISALILLGALGLGYPVHPQQDNSRSITWEKWEPNKAETLAAEGNIVYVDFTARWCVTCQTNKAAVFSSKEVLDWIESNDVIMLKADWTNRDDKITQALGSWNRSAVPFNLIYSPDNAPTPLPEFLTANTVLDALKKAKN